ncbi:UvrB/UvrC motif-containing protein [Niabella hibiscisoli]|uniref:UvrB/UvrC motif-containing protein n=1 Tax=Niabella hibiscisoli TaxID=1825928 RepID=UPI001F10B141|nr:UvrB/UvrC motif-containing protein [Niabella hibiscisoli]MCH5714749.1 UvrB/UvrC motif-containing protein [Niabella hibiscisoli]
MEDVKEEKNRVVKSQKFEEAASLRDTEKNWRKNWNAPNYSGKKKANTNAFLLQMKTLLK